ncbi:MAG: hypothetical protein ABI778_00615 [Ignavibacteriota bacterium]
MKNISKVFYLLAFGVLLFCAGDSFAQSCPMCKESMTQAGAKLSDGFYYSIMSMFALPVSMIGIGTLFVAKKSYLKNHPESEGLSTFSVMKEMWKARKSGN